VRLFLKAFPAMTVANVSGKSGIRSTLVHTFDMFGAPGLARHHARPTRRDGRALEPIETQCAGDWKPPRDLRQD
jgi:hypothetical protein